MICRKQLGIIARGEDYRPPAEPLNPQKYIANVHLRAYGRDIFRFLDRIPNSSNAKIDSYKSLMSRILAHLFPEAPENLITQNVGADTALHLKVGISFSNFFNCLFKYCALKLNTPKIQPYVDQFFEILNFLNPNVIDPSTDIALARPPYKLPLRYWSALVNAASDVRPCFVILGVNTQRTKLFERILSEATGALLLDIPTLIKWPFRPESVEEARKKLLKGAALKYEDSKQLIIECANHPAAMYRGWILPASFHKNNFDVSTLFPNFSEYEQRCFLIELNANRDDLVSISLTRKFDPEDERIITTLPETSVEFIQRLKRRTFVGRELGDVAEEEEEEKKEEPPEDEDGEEEEIDETIQLITPPSYETPEERGDEAQHLEEEDEGAKRVLTLPEESEPQITKRCEEYENEKSEFHFQNFTKRIIIDATQSLKEMSNIVCDKTSCLVPCAYPSPIVKNEEEDQTEEANFSPIGEFDVVSLVDEKQAVKGVQENTLKFYGFTFLFQNKENLDKFAADPRLYLKDVYHTYHQRVILVGDTVSGKKTMMQKLSEFFDIEAVDFKTLLEETEARIPLKPNEEEEEKGEEKTGEEGENEGETSENTSTEAGEQNQDQPTEEEENKEKEAGEDDQKNPDETQIEEEEEDVEGNEEEGNNEGDTNNEEEEIGEDGEIKKSKRRRKKKGDKKKKEKKQRIIPPPIYENGYISIAPSLDANQFKVFQQNETLAPNVIIILKMTADKEMIQKRLQSKLIGQDVEPSAAEFLVDKIVSKVEKYNESTNEFVEALKEYNLTVQFVDASNSIDEVFWCCCYQVCSLLPRCSDPPDGEEPHFGYLGKYCPVTLKDKQLLQSNEELTLCFDGALFAFADDNCQERFRNAPLAFIDAMPIVPPPRVLIIGTRGSGKTSIAQEISRIHGSPVYELPMNPKFVPVNEEEEEPDPEEVSRKTMEPFIEKVLRETNDQKNGWIIEGTPKNAVGGTMMVEAGLKPDFVINLEQTDQWVLMRNRARLNDDEEIQNEEAEDAPIGQDFANAVAEGIGKEPIIINTDCRFTTTMKKVNSALNHELATRRSLFVSESAFDIDGGGGGEDDEEGEDPAGPAKDILKSGRAFLSQFGRYCPVCLHETGQLVLSNCRCGCSFLGRLFFFDNARHRKKFKDDPLTYVLQLHPPHFPFVPRVSVIGKNSELAARLASSLNALLIRPRDVIARVAKHSTNFGAKVRTILATGKAVNAEIFRKALHAVLSRHDCQVRGYVLDGYPTKLEELLMMREDGFMPSDLVAAEKADEKMVEFSIENFHNVFQITDEPTVWMMNINATNKINYNMRQRWESLLAMDEKKAYCVSALDVSPDEVEANLTEFGHYCPVTFVADEIAVQSESKSWENIVKYQGKFYHPVTSEYRDSFIISPIPFVNRWCERKIEFAEPSSSASPSKDKTPQQPVLEGYDVIDLAGGNFVKGTEKLAAVYEDKTFYFITEDHRTEFCKNTERYLSVELPAHRPVPPPPTMSQVSMMPTVAFLEQSVGDVVTECIVELVKRRPKIPGKPLIQSMNEYIATYIRAHSKDIGDLLHQRFESQMEKMNELVSLADTLKASLETPIEMRDEAEHERLCKLWNDTIHKT